MAVRVAGSVRRDISISNKDQFWRLHKSEQGSTFNLIHLEKCFQKSAVLFSAVSVIYVSLQRNPFSWAKYLSSVPLDAKEYTQVKSEQSEHSGLILRGSRIVVLRSFR